MMANDTANSPFIKSLASSDKEIRDQALDSLRTYLSSRSQISELDLLKLWKGLFYCLWMQDKPINQQRLSRDLASLPASLKPSLVLPFLSAFWVTIAREWGSIEALRLDKYLYLIRQYVAASFRYLSKDSWANTEEIDGYMSILGETPLSPGDKKVPNGMRYHVLDVYIDELERVGGDTWEMETLERLMGPVVRLQKESKDKAIRKAAAETLGDERLKVWRGEVVEDAEMKEGSESGEDEDAEWGGIED